MKNIVSTGLFILLFVSSGLANDGIKINFHKGSFESAKEQAGIEGKLFFVDFFASWCSPCQWMDKKTFTDQELTKYVNNNYIAVKVDIDEIEGYEWKEQYDIQYLPTILVFNSEGKLVDRMEETMTAKDLLEVLKSHNNIENTRTFNHASNSSPRAAFDNLMQNTKEETSSKSIVKTTSGRRVKKTSFRLLMGVYENYEKAFDTYGALKSQFIENIIVLNDVQGDKMIYKVLMGEFSTEDEAQKFQSHLKENYALNTSVY